MLFKELVQTRTKILAQNLKLDGLLMRRMTQNQFTKTFNTNTIYQKERFVQIFVEKLDLNLTWMTPFGLSVAKKYCQGFSTILMMKTIVLYTQIREEMIQKIENAFNESPNSSQIIDIQMQN